jgi:DNA-binding Lrp family transcriptional regulator
MTRIPDELDMAIMEELKRNSRISNVAIAGRLKVSEGMVRQRLSRLKRDGVITAFTIRTSSKGLKAMIDINTDINVHSTKIAKAIRGIPGIETVFEVSGNADIVAIVDVTNTPELNMAIESIRGMDNVISTTTRLILGEI